MSSYTTLTAPPPLSSMHSVRMRGGSIPHPPTESAARGSAVDKRLCFRMMVWLCAYYEFYDKKVCSTRVTGYHPAHTPTPPHTPTRPLPR